MASIKTVVKGDFKKTYKFLESATDLFGYSILDKYGQMGVEALREATPKDTGKTADSWSYQIVKWNDGAKIIWTNSNTTKTGIPIALLIQYGHGFKNGTYVQGVDFINPAMKPVFEKISNMVWEEVKDG